MDAQWTSFGCPGSKQYRLLENGLVEIAGEGVTVAAKIPALVASYKDLFLAASSKHPTVKPHWLAGIMCVETRGESICFANTGGYCRGPGCDCRTDWGIGCMAITMPAARQYGGESVTAEQLMTDPGLSIEIAARYWEDKLARYGQDPMKAAAAYVHGSVECGRTHVYGGTQLCPDTDWGVVTGCGYTNKSYGSRCTPSEDPSKGSLVCSDDYPRNFAKFSNLAFSTVFGGQPVVPPPEPQDNKGMMTPWSRFGAAMVGVVLGLFWAKRR